MKRIKTYRLYLFQFHHGCVPSRIRGRCIATFAFYKDLVKEAKRRTVAAGYPKSRWMDLFDWNV
jgi:hypothetical protein